MIHAKGIITSTDPLLKQVIYARSRKDIPLTHFHTIIFYEEFEEVEDYLFENFDLCPKSECNEHHILCYVIQYDVNEFIRKLPNYIRRCFRVL